MFFYHFLFLLLISIRSAEYPLSAPGASAKAIESVTDSKVRHEAMVYIPLTCSSERAGVQSTQIPVLEPVLLTIVTTSSSVNSSVTETLSISVVKRQK